jgi:hypothetical protein
MLLRDHDSESPSSRGQSPLAKTLEFRAYNVFR